MRGTAAGSLCGRWSGGAQDWGSATGGSNPLHSENSDGLSTKDVEQEKKL